MVLDTWEFAVARKKGMSIGRWRPADFDLFLSHLRSVLLQVTEIFW